MRDKGGKTGEGSEREIGREWRGKIEEVECGREI